MMPGNLGSTFESMADSQELARSSRSEGLLYCVFGIPDRRTFVLRTKYMASDAFLSIDLKYIVLEIRVDTRRC